MNINQLVNALQHADYHHIGDEALALYRAKHGKGKTQLHKHRIIPAAQIADIHPSLVAALQQYQRNETDGKKVARLLVLNLRLWQGEFKHLTRADSDIYLEQLLAVEEVATGFVCIVGDILEVKHTPCKTPYVAYEGPGGRVWVEHAVMESYYPDAVNRIKTGFQLGLSPEEIAFTLENDVTEPSHLDLPDMQVVRDVKNSQWVPA